MRNVLCITIGRQDFDYLLNIPGFSHCRNTLSYIVITTDNVRCHKFKGMSETPPALHPFLRLTILLVIGWHERVYCKIWHDRGYCRINDVELN